MKISLAAAALVVALSAGCGTTHDPYHLLDGNAPAYMRLPGVVADVEIADARADTTSREIDVPGMTFPWDDDAIEPALTAAHREFIQSEIGKHFAGGITMSARVVIVKGVKRFEAHTFSEDGIVECELTLDLMRGGNRVPGAPFTGSAMIKEGSMDTGKTRIERLYLKVIAASIEQCIREYARHNPIPPGLKVE